MKKYNKKYPDTKKHQRQQKGEGINPAPAKGK